MKPTQLSGVFKDYQLRSTPVREEILEILIRKEMALSLADLKPHLSGASDRATVYRTLKTFLDKGIIHRVPDGGNTKYAVSGRSGLSTRDGHEHVHFKCAQCGLTRCLEGVRIPEVRLPEGYAPREANLLVEGLCQTCSRAVTTLAAV
ncbi:MAG: transcriptional repressor [Ferruginibacter sp.]|nr:transcriptional repressor [Cytophagales bacterium]